MPDENKKRRKVSVPRPDAEDKAARFKKGTMVKTSVNEARERVNGLMESSADDPAVVEASGLLRRQKEALMTVYNYRDLPGDALIALVKRLVTSPLFSVS